MIMKKKKKISLKQYLVCVTLMLLSFCTVFVSAESASAAKTSEKKNKKQVRIRLSRTNATLFRGSAVKLRLKNHRGRVHWKSRKLKIATVTKKGVVKARKKGKTSIIAINKNKKYRCIVTVINKKKATVVKIPEKETVPVTVSGVSASAVKPLQVDKNALKKVHTGDATWYGDDRNNGYNHGGAYLGDMVSGEKIDGGDTPLYVCAMNSADFLSGMQGAYIRVTASDGKSADVMVTDMEEGGTVGDIDLDRKVFPLIAPHSTGRLKVSWQIIPYPTVKPVQYVWNTTSDRYWAQIQIRNHRYPVVKFEYKNVGQDDSAYVELTREKYNYYTMKSPGNGPFVFRATDILGDAVTDTVYMDPSGTPADGSKNFPY